MKSLAEWDYTQRINITISDSEAIAEVEDLMVRLEMPADAVVKRALIEQGVCMPIEALGPKLPGLK